MSIRHNIVRLGAAGLALGLASPAFADETVALSSVARELGYTYRYLPYENAVSLARPGATVVVRPGDSFFFVNERREPVYGSIPVYRNNDVYVSRAFVDEIRNLGTRYGSADVGRTSVVDTLRPTAPVEPPGMVATAVASFDPRGDRAIVRGTATPGSIVGVTLRAELSSSLPVVVLDRTYVVAGSDGNYEAGLSFGSDRFAPSQYVAEAYGAQNVHPVVARLPNQSTTVRTSADDRK